MTLREFDHAVFTPRAALPAAPRRPPGTALRAMIAVSLVIWAALAAMFIHFFG